jgi:2-methylisocitrate lyase-like PEP mutase family enzyme
VLYAPGLATVEEIRTVCDAVSKPVNVLARPNLSFGEMTAAGAQRVSVGGALAWVAVAGLVSAAEGIRDRGDFTALGKGVKISEWL